MVLVPLADEILAKTGINPDTRSRSSEDEEAKIRSVDADYKVEGDRRRSTNID